MQKIIIGIDPPSSKNMGVAIYNKNKINTENIAIPKYTNEYEQYTGIFSITEHVIQKYKPNNIYIERSIGFGNAFIRKNIYINTFIIIAACIKWLIALEEVSQNTAKKNVLGFGKLNKIQVKNIIINKYKKYHISTILTEHEYDAIMFCLYGIIKEKNNE